MVYSPVNQWTFPVNPSFPWLPKETFISSITQGNPCIVTTTAAHGYSDGLIVRVMYPFTGSNAFGMTEINGLTGAITVLSPTTFSLPINSRGFDPFEAGFSAITNITLATQAVVTVTTPNFLRGQIVFITDVSGMTEINNGAYFVQSAAGSTVTLNVDTSAFTPYSSGGNMENTQVAQILPIGMLANASINDDFTQVNPVNPSTLEQVVIFQKPGLQAGGPVSPS